MLHQNGSPAHWRRDRAPENVHFDRQDAPEITPSLLDRQARLLIARFLIAPLIARVIAGLHYGEQRRAT